ncbi:MAG: stalk domain-containing protein [Caldisericum sp.]|uniref:stalk domain-containing protein n=1 Tax=Caldisericum sp. TaxID=2499687 RepID=UPI003D0B8A17
MIGRTKNAVDAVTKINHDAIFDKYIFGDEDIPAEEFIGKYREGFGSFLAVLESDAWGKEYHKSSIPFLLDIEIAIKLPIDLPPSILCEQHSTDFAKYMFNNYDIDKITKEDTEAVLSKLTGEDCTGFFERWKDSYGELSLEEMKDWLKSYLRYAPKKFQATFENNSVTLRWDQVDWRYPSGYYEITGYAIYRGTSPGKEALIATVDLTVDASSYTDKDIELGKNYYYYVKSIENLYQEIPVYSEPSKEVSVICKDTSPPEIFIYSPSNNFKTNENTITVSGTILDKESGIDKVTVNGNAVSLAFDGSFGTTIMLSEGTNSITVVAIDKAGNQATKTLSITYKKPVQIITIVLQIGKLTFTVNGVQNTLDSPPVIKNSRTLLPIRTIIEALGGHVDWDATERKATVNLGSNTIELWIGKSTAKVNGANTPIDATNSKVVPEIINSRTMLPLRFVTENLGCDVQWDGTTQTITITYTK